MKFDIEFPTCREGVFVPVNFAEPEQIVSTVVTAEALGYHAVWGTDFIAPTPCYQIPDTTPSFVYLVPVVMLFGVGTVPGVIATIIFSISPVIRMTNLGIRQVTPDVVEAGHAYGATGWQMLRDIQFPLALPTVMAGLNQTLLLGMVMGTIASMIGAEGLGLTVLRGIGRLDVGLAAIGGLSIVLMAIVLDRITQALGQRRRHAAPQATTLNERVMRAVFGSAFARRQS
jgi:ABC-type proline/glycine betaine transport system permease subunit